MKKHKGCMLSYLNTATQNAAVQRSVYRVENIDAEKIVPNEKNFYSIEGIEEMANSLAVSDHMAPLEVTANGDGTYRLISGERRLSATLCRIRRGEIDKAELPCHVLPAFEAKGALSAEQVEMLSIIFANNYRQKTVLDQLNEVQQLEPIARAIYQEAKEKGELADANGVNMKFRTFFAEHILSISKSALQRLQTLSQLTDEAKNAFEEGLIGKSVAVEIASLDQELQNSFVASIRAGRLSGTLSDLAAHLKASNPEPEAETEENAAEIHFVEEATFSDTTDEPSQENEAFADAEEAPDQAHQQEGHTAYEVTSPVISSYTEDEDESISEIYEETQGKPLETLLEEEAGQERLITDALSPSETSDDFLPTTENMDSSNEPITAPEAVRILRELLQSMQASGRAHEAAAIDFALDTMKYRYTWINDPVEV
jgi:partition protein